MSLQTGFPARGSELEEQTRRFASLPDYLDEKLNREEELQASFCNALASASGAEQVPVIAMPAKKQRGDSSPDAAKGQTGKTPWVTLVLGAEALERPFFTPPIEKTAQAIAKNLSDSSIVVPGFPPALVSSFITSLMKSRSINVSEHLAVPHYEEWKLNLFYATALLNNVYYTTKQQQGVPINRSSDDLLVLDKSCTQTLTQRWVELERALKTLATSIELRIEEENRQKTPQASSAVSRLESTNGLVAQLRKTTSDACAIDVGDLLALTEVAWYHLVDGFIDACQHDLEKEGFSGNHPYLSWPELMISVGIQPRNRKKNRKKVDYARPHPRLSDIESAVTTIKRKMIKQTESRAGHFRETVCGNATEASNLDSAYESYADTLYYQALLRAQAMGQDRSSIYRSLQRLAEWNDYNIPGSPPAAVAYVTTFDVELELAFHHHHPDMPFVVAIPVNYVYKPDEHVLSRAQPLWLGYRVDPLAGADTLTAEEYQARLLDDILKPAAENWFVLTSVEGSPASLQLSHDGRSYSHSKIDDTKEDLLALPFIVRLTGDPLVQLPVIDPESITTNEVLRTLLGAIVTAANLSSREEILKQSAQTASRHPKLQHALVLEEYHSILRSAPELAKIGNRRLPRGLIDTTSKDEYFRFWTLLGVQASDDAILYQLIAQLMASQLEGDTGAAEMLTEELSANRRLGLAVNRNGSITERARDLLLWSELDVVSDSVAQFSEHLSHYNMHLREQLDALENKVGKTMCKSTECTH